MNIALFLERQCALNDIRRGQLPSILGYKNSSKALRRFDAFVAGNYHDADMLQRLRASLLLCGEGFEEALAFSIAEQRREREERECCEELRARREFIPHLYAMHERNRPEHPFFAIAFLGINTFKRLDLPEQLHTCTDLQEFLHACREAINQVMSNHSRSLLLAGPFGKAIAFECRFTYDISVIFDLQTQSFTGIQHSNPSNKKAVVTLKNKPFPMRFI
jgi:hypothetical protein